VRRARPAPGVLAAALLLVVAGALQAQQPAPPDTALQRPADLTVSLVPLEEAPGPLPPGSRFTFTRDSLLWTSAYTLAELLAEVPGVYVARAGFTGQPAPVFAGGRGPAALEVFYDGHPVIPLGPDSLAPDPGRISLFGLRRVDVERLPGRLRVNLVSERNEDVGARTQLRIVSGDFKTGGYAGLFQLRAPNGLGLDLVADFFDTQGARPTQRNAQWFDVGAKASWVPSPQVAAVVQVRRRSYARDSTAAGVTGVGVAAREDARTDVQIRLLAATQPHRRGLSVDVGLETAAWAADSGTADTTLGTRTVHRGFLGVRAAGRAASVDLMTRVADHYTPVEARLRAGWVVLAGLLLSGDGGWARHDGSRTSVDAGAALALYRGPFSVVGEARWADAVASPMLAADTAQQTLDLAARAGVAWPRVSLHAGLERRDDFAPPPLTAFPGLGALPPSPAATFAVGDVSLGLGALTLSGWVAEPITGSAPSFEPPTRVRAALTFRSKYWRTFRSGAFDLKLQLAVESWGDGVAGTDLTGAPIPLPGATIADASLQIQLAAFNAFYTLRNAFNAREGYVPGLDYPRTIQTFGVKWTFHN